jgi:hypothetical protein
MISLAFVALTTAGRIRFSARCAKASAPKADLPFWDRSDAFSLDESIVEGGKPDPLFRAML